MMTNSFENSFVENSEKTSHFLNENSDGPSIYLYSQLLTFKNNKLTLLTTKLKNEVFYDGTVYTGSAGLALYYFKCSLNENNVNELEYLKKALSYIEINKLRGKRISFLCGDAGPLALGFVVSQRLKQKQCTENLPEYKLLNDRLLSLQSLLDSSPDEILYGKAGYLYALLFVNKYVNKEVQIPPEHIENVITAILESGKMLSSQEKSSSPLMWRWHEKAYLGGAHGMAGILYILLQARAYINPIELREFVKPTLDWLMKQQFPSGNFPSSLGSASGDKLVQWCHGAPGFTSLCKLAAQVFEEQKYMKIAEKLGDVVWQRGLCTKGYSLCHGVSGNAYTFIQLYQATKNPLYLYRACCFMQWCAAETPGTEEHRPDRPASLFEGLLGRLFLCEDLCHIDNATFPGFDV